MHQRPGDPVVLAFPGSVAQLRQQLFVHREVWSWLDEPFQPPPGLPQTAIEQLGLPLAARR